MKEVIVWWRWGIRKHSIAQWVKSSLIRETYSVVEAKVWPEDHVRVNDVVTLIQYAGAVSILLGFLVKIYFVKFLKVI